MTFTVIDRAGNSSVVTLEELLQLRQGMDITVSGYGCSPATVEHSGSCTYKITHENYGVELVIIENLQKVRIYYDEVVKSNCGQGTEEISRMEKDTVVTYKPGLRYKVWSSYQAPCGTIWASSNVTLLWHEGGPEIYHSLTGIDRSDETTCSQTWTTTEMTCNPPVITCENGDCIACDENTPLPDPDGDGCPDATTISTDHTQLNAAANQVNGTNIPIPNAFVAVRFSDGTRRLVLQSEMSLIEDCIEIETPTPIDSLTQTFFVQLSQGGGNATLGNALALRAAGQAQAITAPNPNYPAPGSPTHSPGDTTVPKFTFFIYDHLGNSRILYSNKLIDCNRDSTKYLLEHVLDYYPFGKTLREYVHNRERHQTTYHEREAECGLDFRGARLSDSEVGRFLSVDPLAHLYYGWSPYNYVLGNPIRFIDPTGKSVDDIVYYNLKGQEIHRVKSNTEFKTFIQVGATSSNFKNGGNGFNPSGGMFIEAPMPGVASGFEDAKFQQYDHEIAAETAIFNYHLEKARAGGYVNGVASFPTKGEGYSLGSLPEGNLDVNLVKAMVLEESMAGNYAGGSGTGTTDIMQVNNKGDWSELKSQLGLSYGQTMTPQSSVRAGIGLLFLKSMSANNDKVMNFSSWNVSGYNGGGNPSYSAEVQKFLNSMTPASSNRP